MIFQPARQTAARVTACPGGLLPHLLTIAGRSFSEGWLRLANGGSHSLLCFYALADIFPFGSAVF